MILMVPVALTIDELNDCLLTHTWHGHVNHPDSDLAVCYTHCVHTSHWCMTAQDAGQQSVRLSVPKAPPPRNPDLCKEGLNFTPSPLPTSDIHIGTKAVTWLRRRPFTSTLLGWMINSPNYILP